MNIPKSFPAKGWRKVRKGESYIAGDVFATRIGRQCIECAFYREVKPKAKK